MSKYNITLILFVVAAMCMMAITPVVQSTKWRIPAQIFTFFTVFFGGLYAKHKLKGDEKSK